MKLIALSIFLGSLLLFQVQPLIGKYILPWFGGVSTVWATCMLFFQSVLLGGYAYAHFLTGRFPIRKQVLIHTLAIAATFLWLPMTPPDWLKPPDASFPIPRVLLLLAVSVGGPLLLISATAPLLQSWFASAFPNRSPYRLYALSNAGSLLGLFAYPLAIERFLSLEAQALAWSAAYVVYAGLCIATGFTAGKLVRSRPETTLAPGPKPVPEAGDVPSKIPLSTIFLWLGLSALGSITLLSVTNQLCMSATSVPFLWALPLGLYLVTFILCFERDGWYNRNIFALCWVGAMFLALWLEIGGAASAGVVFQIAIYSFILLTCCMICHGELARMRPHPRHLTLFYISLSLGGLAGSVFVILLAPKLFNSFYEFHIGLFASGLVLVATFRAERWRRLGPARLRRRIAGTAAVGGAALALAAGIPWALSALGIKNEEVLVSHRDFYGVLKVTRENGYDNGDPLLVFTNGNTTHGFQFLTPEKRREPVGYYERPSGVGMAFHLHPRQKEGKPLRVGVIGLGAGALAAYAKEKDIFDFYEINPTVNDIAREQFTYLGDAESRGASVNVVLGDARLALEKSLDEFGPRKYDILVVDAFSSDSVPVHLVTREAMKLYQHHLNPDGILALHVSNRYLDLSPVVFASEDSIGLEMFKVVHAGTNPEILPRDGPIQSEWILGSRNTGFLEHPYVARVRREAEGDHGEILWTDNFSSLFDVLRSNRPSGDPLRGS